MRHVYFKCWVFPKRLGGSLVEVTWHNALDTHSLMDRNALDTRTLK